jgi:hypothetical protein
MTTLHLIAKIIFCETIFLTAAFFVFYAVCKNDPEILDELEGVIE